jgi:flagellar assembly factor FliW
VDRVKIETQRFGTLEAEPGELLHFDGLPGFPDARRFLLREHDTSSVFGWLICADQELAFVVTDPMQFFPAYQPEVAKHHLSAVGAGEDTPLELLCIADVRDGSIHLNLAAPLLIDAATRRGAQIILESGNHPTRAPVRPS